MRARRIVVKVGSSLLAGAQRLNLRAIRRLAEDVVAARRGKREVVLVSSGAIASGYRLLGLKTFPTTIREKQAAAAIGQQRLMRAYAEVFAEARIQVAQVLLTADDLDHRLRFLNARHTLETLLAHGVPTIVAHGAKRGIVNRILEGEMLGTYFLTNGNKVNSRKRWLGFAVRPQGRLTVDDGACRALLHRGSSLLPTGVRGVEGTFEAGAPVEVLDRHGVCIARGLVSYDSEAVEKIRGHKSSEIGTLLGYQYSDEVIHRNDMVVLRTEG